MKNKKKNKLKKRLSDITNAILEKGDERKEIIEKTGSLHLRAILLNNQIDENEDNGTKLLYEIDELYYEYYRVQKKLGIKT